MTLPFNRALGPGLPLEKNRWAAFLAPVHYSPYLSRQFPGMHGTLLPSQIEGRASDHFLGVIPLSPQNLPVFREWLRGYQILWRIDSQIMGLSDGKSRRQVLENLLAAYVGFPRDPFLQSCYFEKLLLTTRGKKPFIRRIAGPVGIAFRPSLSRLLIAVARTRS